MIDATLLDLVRSLRWDANQSDLVAAIEVISDRLVDIGYDEVAAEIRKAFLVPWAVGGSENVINKCWWAKPHSRGPRSNYLGIISRKYYRQRIVRCLKEMLHDQGLVEDRDVPAKMRREMAKKPARLSRPFLRFKLNSDGD